MPPPKKFDVPPELDSEPKTDVPQQRQCTIKVKGKGPKLVEAAVKADSGVKKGYIDPETGRSVDYDCTKAADRKNVELNAVREDGKTVHWPGITMSASGKATVEGPPVDGPSSDVTEQEREDLARYGIRMTDPEPPRSPPVSERSTKGKVKFEPFDFSYVELKLEADDIRTKFVTLDEGTATKRLPEGTYKVSFRANPIGQWKTVTEPLKVEGGGSYAVSMLEEPPYMVVKRK